MYNTTLLFPFIRSSKKPSRKAAQPYTDYYIYNTVLQTNKVYKQSFDLKLDITTSNVHLVKGLEIQ